MSRVEEIKAEIAALEKELKNLEQSPNERFFSECLDNFDWERVHRVMTFLDWEWMFNGVPSIEELKKEAKHHIDNAYEGWLKTGAHYVSSSGGLVARVSTEEGEPYFDLSFVLANWDNY